MERKFCEGTHPPLDFQNGPYLLGSMIHIQSAERHRRSFASCNLNLSTDVQLVLKSVRVACACVLGVV